MANTRRSARISATASHDENSIGVAATARLTRAKTAVGDGKPALQSSKTALKQTTTVQVNNRKRAALGDVSNVHKDVNADKDGQSQHASKIVKTALSTSVSKARGLRSENALEPAAAAQVKRTISSSTAATRKRRTPLRSISVSTASQRQGRLHSSESSAVDDIIEEEESGGNKENVDPLAEKLASEQAALDTKTDEAEPVVQDWDDLDADEMDDPTMVAEYVNEIFDYMKVLEVQTMPNPNYMDDQQELQWKMRDILMDWLVEVHTKFRLLPETLFLAINIVDRFLSLRVVNLDKLQLVGITGMFIAAKYEEVFSPSIQNFVYVADSGYSEEEILRAETFILQVLDYNLSYPNPMNFLRRNSKADKYDIHTRTVAKYLMEIGLLDHRFMKYYPSHVTASAMYLARIILDRAQWDKNSVHYSGGYTEEMIKPIYHLMIDYLVKPVKHEAFFKKYASKRFLKASILARHWAKRHVEQEPLPDSLGSEGENTEGTESS
ncbi:cyclin-like protein [Lipomyces arxii]|uniref:cyclin-like protein n=1 Tax=Lipomyces arxii TaxID=56418 RepID=UPI0034CE810F